MFLQTTKFNDMFPHTGDIHAGVSGHVETAVVLSCKSPDSVINVKADAITEVLKYFEVI